MANKTNPEYEAAKSRISSLFDEIGHLVSEISGTTDPNEVENVIPEEEKSSFILGQSSLIDAYRDRDVYDPRDTYITELEERNAELKDRLANAEEACREMKAAARLRKYRIDRRLRTALRSLTAVLEHEQG